MALLWPCETLRSQNIAVDIAPRSLAGAASVNGSNQVVSSDAGIWKITLGSIVIRNRQHVLAFRAIANLLEGRLGTILVPICRAYQPNVPGWKEGGYYDTIPHSDDSFFSDGTGYVNRVIAVDVAAPATVRATSMTVNVIAAGDIEPGQHFSIDGRLYRVRTFDVDTGQMTFRPPLREAVETGDELNFDDPVCLMRLATDAEMDLDLQMRRSALPTVNFVEAV